jgi:hypothetical protein
MENETTGSSDFDVNAILSEIEGQSSNEPAQVEAAPAPVQSQPTDEITFTANGREIKANLDKIKQYASQGYGASQKIGEFNKKISDYESRLKTYQEYDQKYKPIHEYTEKNPAFWDHVLNTWKEKGAAQETGFDPNNPIVKELESVKNYIQDQQYQQQLAQRQKEDEQLDAQIKSVRDNFKDLDWNAVNEYGENLETQVIKFATDKKIGDFEAAFKTMQFENLMKRAEEKGKQTLQKEKEKQSKLGLLGKSPAPTGQISQSQNIRNKSENDLFNEALRELGLQ